MKMKQLFAQFRGWATAVFSMRSIPSVISVTWIFVLCQTVGLAEESTWQTIQSHIFTGNCTQCHASGNSFARQSGLVLTEDAAYNQLVNMPPNNVAARADGLLRVSSLGGEPGLFQSYLWEKINVVEQDHFYNDHANYGSLMPLGLPSLTNGELDFIKKWIMEGAPETGVVADPVLLDDISRYQPPPFRPLEPPTQGIQLHLGPFDIRPAQKHDREFYYFQPYVTDKDLFIDRYEISYREGSHHFILYNYRVNQRTPTPNVFRDVRDEKGMEADVDANGLFPSQVFVLSQTPYSNYHLPPGVALRLPATAGFDLNVHSVNRTAETRPGEVYVNLHTVDSDELQHVAEYANFSNTDITLSPHKETTIRSTFEFPRTQNLLQMWSHAHEHSTEFRVEYAGGERDGELIYWTNDWEHPPILEFDPPLTFKRGEKIRLVTTYRNDTDQTIRYGPLSSDEMQFLFYIHFLGSPLAGDFNEDTVLDATDIQALTDQIKRGRRQSTYDINFDRAVDQKDRVKWVQRLARTYFGDSNLDGEFSSQDLVAVFQSGQYEDGIAGNSTWTTGDWDGNGEFDSGDFVLAFQD